MRNLVAAAVNASADHDGSRDPVVNLRVGSTVTNKHCDSSRTAANSMLMAPLA